MPSPSKNKGSSWERTVAKQLTEMYGETFIRAPGSGAYVGGQNSERKLMMHEGQIRALKGDIVPPDDWKYFNVECKSYADFPFHQLLGTKPVLLLEEWIEQTLDAADPGDCNILFMKFNRKGTYTAFQLPEKFSINRHLDYIDRNGSTWRITDMNEFLELNKSAFRTRCTNVDVLAEPLIEDRDIVGC